MPETLTKIMRWPANPPGKQAAAPTAEQVAAALDEMSDQDRSMVTMKATLRLGGSAETLNKVTGGLTGRLTAKPISAIAVAPAQMAPVTTLGALTQEQVKEALAAMTPDERVKIIMQATLAAGATKRF